MDVSGTMSVNQSLKVYAPFDRSIIRELPMSGADEVEKALTAAYEISINPDRMIKIPERKEILRKTMTIIKNKFDKFVRDSAHEGGKPWMDTKVEVTRAINGIEVAIEAIPGLHGSEIPMNQNPASLNRLAFTFREPIGVVAAVSAFNHPVNLIIHQVIPAVACGCPVIVKPASSTPQSCINVVDALYEAGLPREWCQVMICGRENAAKLVTDERVAYFSFIGSADVGWKLRSQLAPGTRCALEHGGVAPVIVEADADTEKALPLLAKGGFYHAGQVCVSVQRVYVYESICADVAENLAELADNMIVGDPLDEITEVGPLIETSETDRVEKWVDEAGKSGGKILCGGKRISDTTFEPTVILDPPDEAIVSRHEVFGPVICVYSYKDRHDAIRRANSLPFSFQGAVFTKNIDVALDTAKHLNGSAIMINDHTAFRVDWMPFAGFKSSGHGTGGIPYTMHEMTQEKMVVIKSDVL